MVPARVWKQAEEFILECKKYIWWFMMLAAVLYAFFIITLQIAFTFFISWFAVTFCKLLLEFNYAFPFNFN